MKGERRYTDIDMHTHTHTRGDTYEEKKVAKLVGRFCKSGRQKGDYTIETPHDKNA